MAQDLAKDKTQVWNLEKAYWNTSKQMTGISGDCLSLIFSIQSTKIGN
jgi:hypothetical protein